MNENYTLGDIAAVTRNNNNGGLFGGDGSLLAILFLFGMFGGWGGGFGGGFGGAFLPWLLFGNNGFGGGHSCGAPCATQADLAAGFNNSAVLSGINGIDSALCQGFNGINTAILQSTYDTQGAINGLSHQISDCCCSTKQAIGDLKYTVATEACETRHMMSNNTRDIIDNQNCNTRAILDFMVQNKMAEKDARIAQLENRLSQAEQNAVFRAALDANTAEIIRRTGNEHPSPSYLVPNPHCCYGNPGTFGFGLGNACACGA